jgi:uncharacterized short protein YbdD (DUF466 family)
MAITDINISEELMTDAPSIKYRGEEGPKSPQQEQMMMVDSMLRDEYEQYVYDLLEQRPEATPMSFEEFRQMVIGEGMMGGGNPLPEDPTKPVNPFQPKPIGPLPDKREMAAYGGIMGADGRRQYGIGSFFQKMKDKVVDDLIPNEIKDNKALAAAAALVAADQFGIPGTSIGGDKKISSGISELFSNLPDSVKEAPGKVKDFIFDKPIKTVDGKEVEGQSIAQMIGSSLAKNIVPIAGGLTAGLFTKNQPDQQTGMPSDQTAINLQEYTKAANLLDQKQGLAAGMNFLPAVAARKFTPEEMAITYAQAANGGRIGFSDGGEDLSNDPNYKGWVKTYEMNPDAAEMNENHATYLNFYNRNKNNKAEGGIMDLGGMEKDYRAEGGFVPIGREEKADDVPARLSVNEFVFTADAVRNAGGGDIDQGAKVMENMMKHLEAGGQVSEESQGMAGARDMFEVSERLSEVI